MPTGNDAALIGPSAEGRRAFERYILAFNSQDTEGFTAYYTPDIELNLGTVVLEGPANIQAFYRTMYERVLERLDVHQTVIDEDGIAIEITMTLTAHEDALDFLVAPIPKGHKIWGRLLVIYRLRDGKIADIRIGPMGPMQGPVPV